MERGIRAELSMHVSGFTVDLNLFLQVIVAVFVIALGVLHLVRNTASKYFVVDASFADSAASSSNHTPKMPGFITKGDACAVCGDSTTKQCAGCKLIRYWYCLFLLLFFTFFMCIDVFWDFLF